MLLRARHYVTGELVDVRCADGVIASVEPATDARPDCETDWIAPALFDLQINGCDGHSFSSEQLTIDHVRRIVTVCRDHGIVALLPTLVTNSFAALRHGMNILRQACEQDADLAYAIAGIHLEGPYIAPEDGPRGAHPRAHVRPPDWDEFCRLQEAAGGRIRLVTFAPEHPGAIPFIDKLTKSGVVIALGHTAANRDQIRHAIGAGARLSTHLGNGCHAMLPRHDNYLWEQLAADELWASLICDGHHLPPALVKCLVRGKTPQRIILTCDASSLAGMPPGRYREWDQDLEVLPGGKVVVAGTPYLAGSGVFTDVCVGLVVKFAGATLAEAVDMAGARPRQLLGLSVPALASGHPADLVMFDWSPAQELQLRCVVTRGAFARRHDIPPRVEHAETRALSAP
jgi:N-acetylglucosamine-6-phosphate deacetylase